jgi:dipeptidyl aminopeptidase/acylaminoacyl peptidase
MTTATEPVPPPVGMVPAPAPAASPAAAAPAPAQRTRSRRRIGIIAAAGALTLALLLYLGTALAVVAVMAKPKRQIDAADTPARFQLAYKDVRFPARGGDAEIAAWYLPQPTRSAALVMAHGKDSSRTREHARKNTQLLSELYRSGFTILTIDLRGHGQSSDARFSFGLNEHRDVLGAVDFLRAEGFAPGRIGLHGVSMGGASVLYAAAREPAVGAVVTDCAFAEIEPVIRASWRERTGLPTAVIPAARLLGRAWLGYDILGARPIDEVPRIAPRKLLILHGGADALVPVAHGQRLHAALPGSELVIFPDIRHASLYHQQPAEYVRRVSAFLHSSLDNPPQN